MQRRLKVGLFAVTLLGALTCVQTAAQADARSSTGPINAEADAAAAVYITSDPLFGGRFYCGGAYDNGLPRCEAVVTFGNVVQVFVIGTDHAVWTIWTHDNWRTWSRWTSLGGKAYSYVWFTNYSGSSFTINVIGGDGGTWIKRRYSNGTWSGWIGPP